MLFHFANLCRLLDRLHHIFARHPPYLPHDVRAISKRVITLWFKKHQYDIKAVDGLLLFSYLFPDKHDKRVYGITEMVLARIIGGAWRVSRDQFKAILEPANPGDCSDLGERVEQITQQQDGTHPYLRTDVISIEEIEEVLSVLATRHSYASDPSKSDLLKAIGNVLTDKLAPLYQRCLPTERKWLTRLIMKSYAPIIMPEDLVLGLYHPGLPAMIKLFDLKAAIRFCHRIDEQPLPGENVPGTAGFSHQDGDNGENMSAMEEQPAQPRPHEAGDDFRAAPPLDIPKISSDNEQDKPSNNSSNFISSREWINQALASTTTTACNNPSSQQNEKSSLSPPVVRRASQITRRPAPQAFGASRSHSRSSCPASSQDHCTKTGRDCLFYKKDVALLPYLSRTTAIREMLEKHKATPIDIKKFIEGKVGGRRQVLLVDQMADGLEAAYERIRATHTYDARGRKQWVDIYDWHLLGFINTYGTCRETSQEGWRRYWVGTV